MVEGRIDPVSGKRLPSAASFQLTDPAGWGLLTRRYRMLEP